MTALWRLPGQAVRRLGWGVADQAVSSLTNFAVSIYVVRTLGAVQFGAFSLAYVTYAFALTASRGLATDPLLVRFSATDRAIWRRAVANCTGTAMAVGLTTGACALVAAPVLNGTARSAFLALGLTLPGLLLQDSWRYSFFAAGRGFQAFLNDMVWALMLVPALVLVRATGHEDVFWFVLAWGVPAAVAAVVGPFQAKVIPKLTGAWTWLSRHRDLGPRYFAEGATWGAVSQLRTYGIGLILGLAALGYVQAANTLMGPLTILFLGMSLVAIPEAARILNRSPLRLPLFCLLLSAGLAVAALAWGIVLLVALPRGLGAAVLGPIWRHTYPLVLLQALFVIGQVAGTGPFAGLHALGAARRSLRSITIGSVTYLACCLVGAAAGGIVGTMRGAAIASLISVLITWWQFRMALQESDQVPAGARLLPGRRLGRHRGAPPSKKGLATGLPRPPIKAHSAPPPRTAEIISRPNASTSNPWPSTNGSTGLPPNIHSTPSSWTAGVTRKLNASTSNLWSAKSDSATMPAGPPPTTSSPPSPTMSPPSAPMSPPSAPMSPPSPTILPPSPTMSWISRKPNATTGNSWPPKIDLVTWSPWPRPTGTLAPLPRTAGTSRKPKAWRRRA